MGKSELFSAIGKDELKSRLIENVKTMSRKTVQNATPEQLYEALAFTVRDYITDRWIATHEAYEKEDPKVVYYLSMEFLMGRFLGNAVINLVLGSELREVLGELNLDYNRIEDAERDPGLGNGGLGRLAACFLDSLSTLELPAYGCGIRYHYGIFEQRIEHGYQVEYPDNWLARGDYWGIPRLEYSQDIQFGGKVRAVKMPDGHYSFTLDDANAIVAVPYDYPIAGYDNNTVNTLRLWDARPKKDFDLTSFNKGNYQKALEEENLARTLCEVLYPADDTVAGKELRLKQQYFFISATLQRVLDRFVQMHGNDWETIPDKIAFQLNDTHPSMAVAELMRLLVDKYGLDWDRAWAITAKTCAYTNHTIMSEALEKWPTELFSRLLPRVYMIIEEINRRFCKTLLDKYGAAPDKIRKMAVIADGQVRMAHLAIVGSYSVNGVAALHTDILKKQELKDFYELYPDRFNNKTNGITQRRWLLHSNPALARLVTETIGDKWITDLDELRKLTPYADDPSFREAFMKVKRDNKVSLASYVKRELGVTIDPGSIYDVQVKRLHEYKRQLLNALHILDLYYRIKTSPWIDVEPRTFIFGAKAAAGYARAKLIIKLINNIAGLVNNDPFIEGRVKVLFLPNYRVSMAETLIPAADVSEQISTASKEASGTGNMKFMLNGAVTLGTLDGANVEIREEVGDDNIFIFGMTSDEVIRLQREGGYDPWDVYNIDPNVRQVMTALINGSLSDNLDVFRELYEALLNGWQGAVPDEYFILRDYAAYSDAQARVSAAYKDRDGWARKAVLNTAKSGKFSSDRTIREYADEIWGLKPVRINM
ncbi:MAG: glycogen/starch/alpha-glucan phosphorylase [Clostridiales bacterium]|jgi:starch phosphorylase|nr:glycogen/starch/alpha-glucan phosphorylase [Clostridiales bacterium]